MTKSKKIISMLLSFMMIFSLITAVPALEAGAAGTTLINSPADGGVINKSTSSAITLSATDTAASSVEFKIDGVSVGVGTEANDVFTLNYNASNLALGTHTLEAVGSSAASAKFQVVKSVYGSVTPGASAELETFNDLTLGETDVTTANLSNIDWSVSSQNNAASTWYMQYTEGSAPIDGKLMSLYEAKTGNQLKVSYNGISAANPVTSGSFDVEYDMKLNYVTTGSGSTQMGQSPAVKFSNTGSSHLFDSSSKKTNVGGEYYADMYGEGKVYVESNKWIHVKYTYDVDNRTMKCVVTKDGTDYTFGPVTNDAFGRISDLYLYWIPWSAEGTWKGISLDNMRVSSPQTTEMKSAVYTLGTYEGNADDGIFKTAESLKLNFGTSIDNTLTASQISLKVDNGTAFNPSSVSVSDDLKTLTISLPGDLNGDKLYVSLDESIKHNAGQTLDENISYSFDLIENPDPVIILENPADGAMLYDGEAISYRLENAENGKLYVDGSEVSSQEISLVDDVYSYVPGSGVSYGNHKLKITAEAIGSSDEVSVETKFSLSKKFWAPVTPVHLQSLKPLMI